MQNGQKRVGIVGGAAVPHAPQLLSVPKSEDPEQVARVRATMLQIGDGFRKAKPDLIIVVSNDHGDDFILHSVPPFMIHCGQRAQGRDAHAGWWRIDGKAGYALLNLMQDEGFDPAFTLDAGLGTFFTIPIEYFGYDRDTPVLPIFVNSYVAPQPSPMRCFAFGQALARAVERMGLSAAIIASGGLSHYPGTTRYASPGPDLGVDEQIYRQLAAGNLRHLLSFDAQALDRAGNIELRAWLILAGALGEKKPDITMFEPNWHHTYGLFGWTDLSPEAPERLWYPPTPSDRVELSRALFALRTDSTACDAYLREPEAFAAQFDLLPDERTALLSIEEAELRDDFCIHPLLVAGAIRRLQIRRKSA